MKKTLKDFAKEKANEVEDVDMSELINLVYAGFDWHNNKTDLEKFIELYKSFGIELIIRIENDNQVLDLNQKSIFGGGSEKFTGYGSFNSIVTFDKEGKFISQGFWE